MTRAVTTTLVILTLSVAALTAALAPAADGR